MLLQARSKFVGETSVGVVSSELTPSVMDGGPHLVHIVPLSYRF